MTDDEKNSEDVEEVNKMECEVCHSEDIDVEEYMDHGTYIEVVCYCPKCDVVWHTEEYTG